MSDARTDRGRSGSIFPSGKGARAEAVPTNPKLDPAACHRGRRRELGPDADGLVSLHLARQGPDCRGNAPAHPVRVRVGHRDGPAQRQSVRPRAASARPQNDVVQHHLALPHKDVAATIETVQASGSAQPAVKLAFEFLVLTAARSGEVRLATWAEMDTPDHVWAVSASVRAGSWRPGDSRARRWKATPARSSRVTPRLLRLSVSALWVMSRLPAQTLQLWWDLASGIVLESIQTL